MTLLLSLKRWMMINEFAQAFFSLIQTAAPGKMAQGRAIILFHISYWEPIGKTKVGIQFVLLEATPCQIYSDN